MSTPSENPARARESGWRAAFDHPRTVLFAAALLWPLLFVPLLARSFWIDEAGTYWIARDGLLEAVRRSLDWSGHSILYCAVASLFCIGQGPWREFLLRVPSLIGYGAALYFTGRLAEKAVGKGAGLVAAVLLGFLPGMVSLATQARPYGLAIAAVAASYCLLYEWVETRERGTLAGYVAASVAVVYLHYVFAVAFAGQALYLAWVFFRQKRTEAWGAFAAAAACGVLLLLPLAAPLSGLAQSSRNLSFARRPTLLNLAAELFPPALMIAMLAAALAVAVTSARPARRPVSLDRGILVLAAAWWLPGTILLYIVSTVTRNILWVDRYLAFTLPAVACLLTRLAFPFFRLRELRLLVVLTVVICNAPYAWSRYWRTGQLELLPVFRTIRSISPENRPPVLLRSDYVESNYYDWRRGRFETTYSAAPLAAYPIANRVFLLPWNYSAEVERHVEGLMAGELKGAPEVIYAGWRGEALTALMARFGYRATTIQLNFYRVIVFRRGG